MFHIKVISVVRVHSQRWGLATKYLPHWSQRHQMYIYTSLTNDGASYTFSTQKHLLPEPPPTIYQRLKSEKLRKAKKNLGRGPT